MQKEWFVAWKNAPPLVAELGSVKAPEVTVAWLCDYIASVCGAISRRTHKLDEHRETNTAIILTDPDTARDMGVQLPVHLSKPDAYVLKTVRKKDRLSFVAASRTPEGLRQAILHLIREFRQKGKNLVARSIDVAAEPWVPHRETMFLAFPRPQTFEDPGDPADPRLDVMGYEAAKLDRYVDMILSFGFNGIQVSDIQHGWAIMGKTLAEGRARTKACLRNISARVRQHGCSVSDFIYGGFLGARAITAKSWNVQLELEFQEAVEAWNREDTHEHDEIDDAVIREVHDRWYECYAELAQHVDRIVVHWGEPFSPLKWRSPESKLKMHRFLMEHFLRKNPSIDCTVNTWRSWSYEEFVRLVKDGKFPDGHLFLEMGLDFIWSWEQKAAFRSELAKKGYRVGQWGWYTEDFETDQTAFMCVNDLITKEHYQITKERLDPILATVYRSVIDAAHMVNIYSLYVASRLLWNPDQDTAMLLREITEGIWGPRNGPKVLGALLLIRDVRTGPSWKYYWPWCPEYRVGTPDSESDLQRARKCLKELKGMKIDRKFVPKFPLPLTPRDLVELIIPNLEQIAIHAENRLLVKSIIAQFEQGADQAELVRMERQFKHIKNLGTWVGAWGQYEQRDMARVKKKLIGIVYPGARTWDLQYILRPVRREHDCDNAFDGNLETTWISDVPAFPTDLGYAWTSPQTVSRVALRFIDSIHTPCDPGKIRIEHSDRGKWSRAEVRNVRRQKEKNGNETWTFEFDPVTARWFRAVFLELGQGGKRPAVSEMSFWDGDRRVETRSYELYEKKRLLAH